MVTSRQQNLETQILFTGNGSEEVLLGIIEKLARLFIYSLKQNQANPVSDIIGTLPFWYPAMTQNACIMPHIVCGGLMIGEIVGARSQVT